MNEYECPAGIKLRPSSRRSGLAADLAGQVFGRWTVIESVGCDGKRGAVWGCKCECGTMRCVRANTLLTGKSRSCGCLTMDQNKNKTVGRSVAAMRQCLNGYKQKARTRGLSFDLSDDEWINLTQQNCYYCGAHPGNVKRNESNPAYGDFVYNGLGRVNNNIGYTPSNVVTCCRTCNRAKADMEMEDFLKWIADLCQTRNERSYP